MGKINIADGEYKNFGRCKIISNKFCEIYVTTDIGPRIIKANLTDKENLMFNDVDRTMREDVSSVFGEGKYWHIYGGHRLWVSPEDMPRTYYPDNEPVAVSIDDINGRILFTPPVQKINNLQHSLEIEMSGDKPNIKVTHKIENTGEKEITGAIWALSVMTDGGIVVCPQPDEDTGLLGNRLLALWPYSKMTDSRVNFFDKYITVRQDGNISEKFKFGINNTKGWLAYYNHGQILKKIYEPNHSNNKTYPDGGMSTEVFANNLFVEAETLSELRTIKHGESITHTEIWELIEVKDSETPDFDFNSNQDKTDAFVRKYII
ncbi:MAG: hypothetical protein FWH10_01090 [Oscillospiraceae bacterium]|nr:hypothetical protein [Oscillospiraceae bacterium]